MTDDLDDLYQQVVIDHSRKPRNFREIVDPDAHAQGYNALCGDKVHVFLKLDSEHQHLADVSFTGSGCAICTATASLMTQAIRGMSRAEVDRLFHAFHELLTGKSEDPELIESLGKLAALLGVRRFPMRVKCATLPWHTLKAAIDQKSNQPVTTE